jgi:hypothetical protein
MPGIGGDGGERLSDGAPALWPGQPPIAAQNPQQLWGEHDITVLAALALLDPDHHPLSVDVVLNRTTSDTRRPAA